MTRIAELCAGYGGLALGLSMAGVAEEVIFLSEIDKWASRVLAERFPLPNLGDIKGIDWENTRHRYGPIDILTAGYPCQPFSTAGRRLGEEDPRHLWPFVAEAIRVVRPRLAFLENVRGHVSKGLDTVIGDLSSMGYVGAWGCLRASDIGAAHRRERVFILAANTDGSTGRPWDAIGGDGDSANGYGGPPDVGGRGRPTADAERLGDAGRGVAGILDGAQGAQRLEGGRCDEGGSAVDDRCATPADAESDAWRIGDGDGADAPDEGRWGKYAPAVARWERILGRPAPIPAIDRKLNPVFVEWLMGLPAGWVTGVAGVSRSQQLKILGNGVVPQQAAVAFRLLAGRVERVLAEAG